MLKRLQVFNQQTSKKNTLLWEYFHGSFWGMFKTAISRNTHRRLILASI